MVDTMARMHCLPMNKFAHKLHGYIVYFKEKLAAFTPFFTQLLIQENLLDNLNITMIHYYLQGITATKICLRMVAWIKNCLDGCRSICPPRKHKNKEDEDGDMGIPDQIISPVKAQVIEPRTIPDFTIPVGLDEMRKGYHEIQGLDCCGAILTGETTDDDTGQQLKSPHDTDQVDSGIVDELVQSLGEALRSNRKMCAKQLRSNESLPDPTNSMYRYHHQRHTLHTGPEGIPWQEGQREEKKKKRKVRFGFSVGKKKDSP